MHFLPSIFRDIKLIICCLLKDYSNKFSSPYYGEAEIARARNCQNGKCTTWKIPEWAMYNPEIDRKFRPWKMTENHAWKMLEWKLHTLENDIKITPWKITEKRTWKMPEWKLHTLENDRKITPRKMTENAQLEFARMENAHPGKCQNGNCTPRKMTEKSHPGK